ncbi:MAG: Hsp33 family molecular chaperone HslO [Parasporobacterium sp.]|nr:Hsp33 family molecular chaperone HslO [Parasporobacterium sp.]
MSEDYILRATAADLKIRAFAITSTNLVEYARQRHNTSPVATAALGRLLSAGAMMGVMMKGEKDVLTLQMKGDGPIEGLTVTADSHGNVKGYPGNPNVIIPVNYAGKLDVGAAIGYGELIVIKDLGMKEPYVSQTPLGTSEVAEDLTFYFAKSEQTPSSVALGVLMNRDNTVAQAGGFIIQVMPGIDEAVIDQLEEKISKITSVTSMMESGMGPEEILQEVLGEFDLQINEKIPTRFYCDCSKSKVSRALIAMGKTELQNIIEEGKEIEVKCHFCNTDYTYSIKEVEFLLQQAMLKSAARKLGLSEKPEPVSEEQKPAGTEDQD